jgi:uncharacterized protein
MTKPVRTTCYLECEYCHYPEKADLYPGSSNARMSPGTLEEYVTQYIEASPGPVVTFA